MIGDEHMTFLTLRCYSLFRDAGKSTKYGPKEYWPMGEINALTAVVWPSEWHVLPPTLGMTLICGMHISCILQIRWSLACTTPGWMHHSSIKACSFHLLLLINPPQTLPLAYTLNLTWFWNVITPFNEEEIWTAPSLKLSDFNIQTELRVFLHHLDPLLGFINK